MRIRKVGVVGAGAMGSGIAALAASAGVPVVLLDIPGPDGDRSAPAKGGLQKALKGKPAPFMDPDRARLIRTGNTEDDLALLADCDWVVEAIIEQPKPKQELYGKLERLLRPEAIVTSNTSGIPMTMLLKGRGEKFRSRFLGTHFFNPPRYMHLLELIPTPETDPAALESIRTFAERTLGKGIVLAKDVPGFVANRLGIFGIVAAMRLMEKHGLSIDEVDYLTGPFIGRPKTATFRTGDLSGLDVIAHVAEGLSQTTGEDFSLPSWVTALVKSGRYGDKTQAGFYRKEGKQILSLDWKTDTYAPQQRITGLEDTAKASLPDRIAAIRTMQGPRGEFLRDLIVEFSRYSMALASTLAYDLPAIDRAMEWGYGWEVGPFRTMDLLGHDFLKAELGKRGAKLPVLLEGAKGSFYVPAGGMDQVLRVDGSGTEPYPHVPGSLRLDVLHAQGKALAKNAEAAIVDLGDGVLCVEFRGKMNALGPGAGEMIHRAIDMAESGKYVGVVIGNDDPRTFSAGANLGYVMFQVNMAAWKDLDAGCRAFQDTSMRIRHSAVPVVAAPFGLALGGGCEFSMHADRIQAGAELYMGLVEVGVGIIPAGGGTKELAFRFTEELQRYDEADLFEGIKRAFKAIALAATSTSALEARRLGFLRPQDRISMNRDLLLADAKMRVLDLAPDYVAPQPRTIRALGKEGMGNLQYALWAFGEAGQATETDLRIGREVAYVLCGGDGPPRDVTEQDLLDLEREAFLKLLGTKETQARMEHMLKTGKPLRN